MTAAPIRPIFPALLLLLCSILPAPAQTAGAGVSFVAALPTTAASPDPIPTTVTLLLASELGSDVAMIPSNGSPTSSVNVPPGGTLEVVLDSAVVLAPDLPGIWRSSLRLSGTQPFTATLLIDRAFAVEAVSLIPDAEQQREAFLVSSDVNENGGMMIVVGLIDGTVATITPAVATVDGHAAGIPYTVALGLGDVYQTITASAGSAGDLSGTRVESTLPVGVIGGTRCTNFPVGADHACNPLVEAMPHVGCLGSQFILAPLAKQDRARARLVATEDGTTVTLGGTLPLGTLRRGEYLELTADTAVRIVASHPAIVEQYVTSTATGRGDLGSAYGDPSMMTVPPLESDARAVRTVLPSLGPRSYATGTAGWDYYIQVVCDSSAFASVRVNGGLPAWSRIDGVDRYRVGVLPLGPGELTVVCDSSIGVQVYGYSLQDAFGTTPFSCATAVPVDPPPARDTSRLLRLRLVGDTVPIGQHGSVALLLDSAGGFAPGDQLAFEVVVVWERSVAVPTGTELLDSAWSVELVRSEVQGEERRATVHLRTAVDSGGVIRAPSVIARLGVLATLGAERSWVAVDPLLSNSALPRTVDTAGSALLVTGQCPIGSPRVVRVGDPLLRSVVVDPSGVTAVLDSGVYSCTVHLYDLLGREVDFALWERGGAERGVRFVELAPGWYLLAVRAGDGREERCPVVVP